MKLPHFNKRSFGKAPNHARQIAHQVARDPYVDWTIIFAVTLCLTLALIAYGLYAYLNLNNELGSTSRVKSSTAATIDTKSLSAALSQFDDRSKIRSSLLQGYGGSSDPSL